MHRRTRVVQRNMRMVLILVDGKATVADLCDKTGNSQLVEIALKDLEEGGFIAPMIEQDSVWEQSRKVAEEIRAAALAQVSQLQGRAEPVEIPAPPKSPVPPPVPFSIAPLPFAEIDNFSIFESEIQPSAVKSASGPENRDKRNEDGLLARLKKILAGKPRVREKDVRIKPIQRGRQGLYITWPIAVIFGLLGLIVLTLLTSFLFPYSSFLPDVEAALVQACGQPVKVGEMRVSFYPRPGFVLDNVRIGSKGQEMHISALSLQPVLGTLTASKKVFREVELTGVTMSSEVVLGLSGIFESVAKPTSRIGVQHLTLEKTDISFNGLGFGETSGEIRLAADGRFQLLSLHTPDRSMRLDVRPAGKGVDVELEAYGWKPSASAAVYFDSANVKGNIEGGTFNIGNLELRTFDGLVQGTVVLRAEKSLGMAGDIVFERISARRFGEALGIGPQFEGETAGKMKFSATADSWSGIFAGLNADGVFNMRRGKLGGIDLASAVRNASAAPTQGGSTHFEQLTGRFRLQPGSYRFSGLALTSGLMQANGQLSIGKGLQLSGGMDVQMHGTVNQLRMPVVLGGPLNAPTVQVDKR